MPIYTYRVFAPEGDGPTFEVMQGPAYLPYETSGEIDPETVVRGKLPILDTPVTRIASTPGLFRGLPTPKFHG